ncbi:unnamed protein product, partial [Mesorhabditis belari]|uniref:Cytochrome b561 domain-containing protein n=1 Tax=Mesorhabditis belari TaxID=2138241 RepID=A0AAF3E928_9BILA
MALIFDPNFTMLTEERSWKLFNQILVASQVFGGLAIVFVAIWMGSYDGGYGWSDDPKKEFHYHPTFMVMGLVFLYGESILIYRVFRNERKRFTKLLHMGLHSMVLIFMFIALKAVWDSHDLNIKDGKPDPLPNLISLHSWIGITTVAAFCGQYVLGFSAFLYPGFSMATRQIAMPFHQLFGVVIFGMVSLTVALGISERAAWAHTCWTQEKELCGKQVVSNFLGLFVFLYSACVIVLVGNPRWRRKPLPEEEMLHGMSLSSSRDPMD